MPDPDLPVLLLSQKEQKEICADIPTHPDELICHYTSLGIPLDKGMTLIHVSAFWRV